MYIVICCFIHLHLPVSLYAAVIVHVFGSRNEKCYITVKCCGNKHRNVFIHRSELRFGPEQGDRTVFEIEYDDEWIQLKTDDDRYVIPKEGKDGSCPCVLAIGDRPSKPAVLGLKQF